MQQDPQLHGVSIYTIVLGEKLAAAMRGDRTLSFEERRRWTSGEEQLRRASEGNLRVAIFFAPAEGIAGLTHWGLIDSIVTSAPELENPRTLIQVSELREIHPSPPISSLVVHATGRPLSENYIRPYVIVRLPDIALCPA